MTFNLKVIERKFLQWGTTFFMLLSVQISLVLIARRLEFEVGWMGALGLATLALFPLFHILGYCHRKTYGLLAAVLHGVVFAGALWLSLYSLLFLRYFGFGITASIWAFFHLAMTVVMVRHLLGKSDTNDLGRLAFLQGQPPRNPVLVVGGYSIYSSYFALVAEGAQSLASKPFICLLWRGISSVIFSVVYLFLASMPLLFVLPFQAIRKWNVFPPSAVYWILASLIMIAVVCLWCFLGFVVVRELRQKRIDVEFIVFFVGTCLAIVFGALIFPNGWTLD